MLSFGLDSNEISRDLRIGKNAPRGRFSTRRSLFDPSPVEGSGSGRGLEASAIEDSIQSWAAAAAAVSVPVPCPEPKRDHQNNYQDRYIVHFPSPPSRLKKGGWHESYPAIPPQRDLVAKLSVVSTSPLNESDSPNSANVVVHLIASKPIRLDP